MRTKLAAALCAAALSIIGCTRGSGGSDIGGDSARPAATSAVGLVYAELPGTMASRREAQDDLDHARRALGVSDLMAAAEAIALATPILRDHAGAPVSSARTELRSLADSLDGFATDLRAGRFTGVRMFDALLVRVNVAEAQHHRSLAMFAWSKEDHRATGEELIMSADHLDRAMRDAGRLPRATKTAVADALDLGGRMATAKPFKYWEVTTTFAALDKGIQENLSP